MTNCCFMSTAGTSLYNAAFAAEEKTLKAVMTIGHEAFNRQKEDKLDRVSVIIGGVGHGGNGSMWRRTVHRKSRALFILHLYEYLRGLPIGDAQISVSCNDAEPVIVDIAESDARNKYAELINDIGKKLTSTLEYSDKAWGEILNWRKSECSAFDNLEDEYTSIRPLADYAIFGPQRKEKCPGIYGQGDELIVSVFHPYVLLSRLNMAYLICEEIENELDYSVDELKEQEENHSIFFNTLRTVPMQFIKHEELYAVDQRYGTLSFMVYEKMYPNSSIRPIALPNVAEKLLLDITECEAISKSETISILIVGSIVYGELKELNRILKHELEEKLWEKVKLTVCSPLEDERQKLEIENEEEKNLVYLNNKHITDMTIFKEEFYKHQIVFLIDPLMLYRITKEEELVKFPQSVPYVLMPHTARNDIVHFSQVISKRYMQYTPGVKLRLDELLLGITYGCKVSHLCVLLSYSQQEELIRYSVGTQEVRKEIVALNKYTTLLRYRIPRLFGVANEPMNERITFLFRVQQWYKMTPPYLSCFRIEGHKDTYDRILYRIICKVSLDNRNNIWRFELHDAKWRERGVSAITKDLQNYFCEQLKARIDYAISNGEHNYESVLYAKQMLANLLVARSANTSLLIQARSVLYYNKPSVQVEWNNDDNEFDIEKYNFDLRNYHMRYADYLILCAIDKSGQNKESVSVVYRLMNSLSRRDGFEVVRRLGEECRNIYFGNEKVGYSLEAIKRYYNRITSQARFLLR